jgi:hypothetical protein
MDHLSYFRSLYGAFNRRDADSVLRMLSDDVDWPNAWKGGRLRGHGAVRDYWAEQWSDIDPHVEPISVVDRPDGSIEVSVRQVVRSHEGELLSEQQVLHIYRLRGELVTRMDAEEPRPRNPQ